MKIKQEFPPNYSLIKLLFPHLEEHTPIFSHGDIVYNPFKIEITKDLEIHEEVHSKRQGNNPVEWWARYLEDKEFRLEEEILAYGTQLAWIRAQDIPTKLKEWKEEKLAEALSSPLYGSMVSYGEAKSKIRNYAKNI